jgi:threonine/homoserine/homoserine lactone efflux protein
MDLLILFLLALSLGFAAAIPIGPCQIEMAKRAIKGHMVSAYMVVLGSVSSDIVYGGVALFGIAPFLEIPGVLATFSAVGAIILWILSYMTWKDSKRPHDIDLEHWTLRSKRWAYLTGFSVGMSNPPIIMSWLVGVALAKRFGLATPFTLTSKILFIGGGAIGLGGYHAILGVVMHRLKHVISARAMGRVYHWLAVTLFVLSGFFVYGVVKYFLIPR